MSARTITGTVLAFVSQYTDPTNLHEHKNPLGAIVFAQRDHAEFWAKDGYTMVGEVDVTVRLMSHDAMVQAKVESLRAEKAKTLADAQAKATAIEKRIQSLLAISFDGGAA